MSKSSILIKGKDEVAVKKDSSVTHKIRASPQGSMKVTLALVFKCNGDVGTVNLES